VRWLRTSLLWKITLAFVLVVLVAVGSVALVARQTTTSEFQRLRAGESQTISSDLGSRLGDFYAANGSWDGVAYLLSSGRGQGQGGRGGPPIRLADAEGRVVLNTAEGQTGQSLTAEELAAGEPIFVDDELVGVLLLGGRGTASLSQSEQEYLERVQSGLIIGALIAISVAVIIGFLLFREITAPLRQLTQATEAVASGDLSVQVPTSQKKGDEIAQLSVAFNQMTTDLAHADRLRRDMTADIAHELRTPLTVIQGNLEAIMDGVYPADAEHLEPVLRKTQVLRHLVEDLRTLALADAGELRLHVGVADLGRLAQRTVNGFELQAKAVNVALTTDIPAQLPPVTIDAPRIEQVLSILLENALRHTRDGGQIRVALQRVDGEAWLSVQDTGEGISPEDLGHVFERYFRGPDGNTGLGLSIAAAIINAHQGRIWAESREGQGTSVAFALPFTDERQENGLSHRR
jgi:two-component system sensor histidine kinase BaeS